MLKLDVGYSLSGVWSKLQVMGVVPCFFKFYFFFFFIFLLAYCSAFSWTVSFINQMSQQGCFHFATIVYTYPGSPCFLLHYMFSFLSELQLNSLFILKTLSKTREKKLTLTNPLQVHLQTGSCSFFFPILSTLFSALLNICRLCVTSRVLESGLL